VRDRSEEEREVATRRWRQRWLTVLQEHLSGRDKELLQELVAEFGMFEHPDFATWSSGIWVGPTSPVEADQLQSMELTELLEFLRSWRAPSGSLEDSPAGLGRALAAAVTAEPQRFAEHAHEFRGV